MKKTVLFLSPKPLPIRNYLIHLAGSSEAGAFLLYNININKR